MSTVMAEPPTVSAPGGAEAMLDQAVNDAKRRAPSPTPAPAGVPAQSIVVAVDGSSFSLAALGPAEQMARCFHLPLVLVEAVRSADPPYSEGPLDDERGEAGAVRSLHAAAEEARAQGFKVSEVVVTRPRADDPAAVILQAADAFNAKMIVMATHGRTGISRALHGSVADAVVHGTNLPVLLVGPQS